MTRGDIVTRLRNYFENNVYFSTQDFLDSIQDGYDEAVAFSGCIIKATTLPFTQYTSYYDMMTLIPDYIGIFAIFNSITKRWLGPTSIGKLDRHRVDWETAYGTPEYFAIPSHRYVALFRKPGTASYGDMYLYYIAKAPTLNTDADTILIPDNLSTILEDYSVTDLQEQQQEWTKAGNYLNTYINNIQDLRQWAKNQRLPARRPSL